VTHEMLSSPPAPGELMEERPPSVDLLLSRLRAATWLVAEVMMDGGDEMDQRIAWHALDSAWADLMKHRGKI